MIQRQTPRTTIEWVRGAPVYDFDEENVFLAVLMEPDDRMKDPATICTLVWRDGKFYDPLAFWGSNGEEGQKEVAPGSIYYHAEFLRDFHDEWIVRDATYNMSDPRLRKVNPRTMELTEPGHRE